MEEPASLLDSCLRGPEPCRAHRIRILTALKGICLQIARLQRSEEGRIACGEVARMLDDALARETASMSAKKP